jgi:hypothetical protein
MQSQVYGRFYHFMFITLPKEWITEFKREKLTTIPDLTPRPQQKSNVNARLLQVSIKIWDKNPISKY